MKQFFYAFVFIFFCSGIKGFAGDLLNAYEMHLPTSSPEQTFFLPPPPPLDTFILQLPLNGEVTFCIDTSGLPGQLSSIEAVDCGGSIDFGVIFIDEDDACVNYEGGNDSGLDEVCIEICSTSPPQCDTTQLLFLVSDEGPMAQDDEASTSEDTPVTIDVLANDSFIAETTVTITTEPANGSVTVNSNNTVTYTPEDGFCGTDQFIYEVCVHPDLCDDATVTVSVGQPCPPEILEFFDSFSPNRDGINDTFVIEGVDSFPGNTLRIYNRWGVQVFEGSDYNNDWDGKWNGKDLPDGTYFYHFDDGIGNIFSGYIMLYR